MNKIFIGQNVKRIFLVHSNKTFLKKRLCSVLIQSYDHGSTSNKKLLSKTIGTLLDEATEKFPEKEAVIFCNDKRRKTYSQLHKKVDDLAAGLLTLNLTPGDRVGIWGQNHMEWLLVFLACAKAGLILVNVNPAYKSKELHFALNKVEMKALFLMPKFKTSDFYEILSNVVPEINNSLPGDLNAKSVPSLRYVIMTEGPAKQGTFSFDELLSMGGFQQKQMVFSLKKKIQFDSPVNIQFTSGTTGFPKGVTLTHHNLVNNGYIVGHNLNTERTCIPVPLYHCFGMVLGSLACISHGKTQVFPGRGFDAKSTLEAIHSEKCTAIYGTPVMFIDMLNHPEFKNYNFSSLRTGIMGGSPCPVEIMNQVVDKMNCSEMTIVYGLTETSPATNMTARDDPIDLRVSTIGKIIPHMEVKLVDESGEVVPVGVKGELCYRGHCIMQGYWGEDKKTKEVIDQNNWFHTGDIGVIDENGYCKVIGRLKDMIIRGGTNIYPVEVEQFLYSHPAIEDVQVVGVPDYRAGEEVCAVIRLKTGSSVTADDIKVFCKDKVSHYKVPRYFHFVTEYPMTVTGKVKKNELRESMTKLLKEGRL
ncbi:medium-chain acyl-CoA ligase ACSF2, mitochondrial-like isoform X1 [Hydra vulgaris]|uniref:Medium-chain acyl-CoA ligase ACSF2, mitochondrial n=2 Tax=Hydra vulgaris TaxID=6087 RepID=A0ABM4BH66_HYDVU